MKNPRIIPFIAAVLLTAGMNAHVTLPDLFSDHMVLQQETTVTVWGWAKPNEVVRIACSWDPDKEYRIEVESHGTWSIDIETPPVGGPYQLRIEGYNTIEIHDILIGEIWLGSGQSNMEWSAAMGIDHAKEEIAGADFPEIRFFTVHTITAGTPQQLVKGEWVRCTPGTMQHFSALMYFFGRELYRELNVPVGLINSSWGGTPIEIWMPESRIRGDRQLDRNAGLLKPVPWGPIYLGVAFNAMIHPLVPFRTKGALWYQGEANVDYPDQYARALKALIDSWRASWGYDFPFYYAQIAPWAGYGDDNVNGAILRDQQRLALNLTENTGMVVLSDIGNLENIHPGNKQDAGKRLAGWVLHHDYGFSDRPFSGPLFRSCEMDKGRIILDFDYADGLTAREGIPREFEVLDRSGSWVEAEALISGDQVDIDIPDGGAEGVRYAFRNDAYPSLFNGAGLPASCFEIMFPGDAEKK
jgi:sialate O-acetylesterase